MSPNCFGIVQGVKCGAIDVVELLLLLLLEPPDDDGQPVPSCGSYKNWTIESLALSSAQAVRSSYPRLLQSNEMRSIGQYRQTLHAFPPTVI